MALMFARLAHNFIKNGYYPTDSGTLERILQMLEPSEKGMTILDPCAGEGTAIAEIAHHLGGSLVQTYAVEYDKERALHARNLVDHCLHADLMDTIISRGSFGLLFLNPPYGDLSKDSSGNLGYEGKGKARLEKLFYQRSFPLLQYDGIMVLLMPYYVLDDEFVGWLTRHLTDISIHKAVENQFKQIVVIGKRIRHKDQNLTQAKEIRQKLLGVGQGYVDAPVLPQTWSDQPYVVPPALQELEHFYRVTLEPEQFSQEVAELEGLWPEFDAVFNAGRGALRRPAHSLSNWHLALSLAGGAISGVIKAKSGRVLVVKGDTHKEKVLKTEYCERDDGSIAETRILTDKFIPVIKAWDLTPDSITRGEILTIK